MCRDKAVTDGDKRSRSNWSDADLKDHDDSLQVVTHQEVRSWKWHGFSIFNMFWLKFCLLFGKNKDIWQLLSMIMLGWIMTFQDFWEKSPDLQFVQIFVCLPLWGSLLLWLILFTFFVESQNPINVWRQRRNDLRKLKEAQLWIPSPKAIE